ncbi:MAG: hypothetical protein AB7N71_13410, partial [Phycisphaerae bacterium]
IFEVSVDEVDWLLLETVPDERAWGQVEFRIFDYLPNANTMRIRFIAADVPNNSVFEAAVDDVVVNDVQCESSALLGDMNCDGVISVGDIAGFVLALTDPSGYAAQFPDCNISNADINGDLTVSVGDIGPFVALLTGG